MTVAIRAVPTANITKPPRHNGKLAVAAVFRELISSGSHFKNRRGADFPVDHGAINDSFSPVRRGLQRIGGGTPLAAPCTPLYKYTHASYTPSRSVCRVVVINGNCVRAGETNIYIHLVWNFNNGSNKARNTLTRNTVEPSVCWVLGSQNSL